MKRVAIPIFRNRVSPVFDSCERLLIIDIDQNSEKDRKEIYLDDMPLSQRLAILKQLYVTVVICSGISETLHKMLSCCDIRPICGIAGDVEDVVCAFCCNRLDQPKYFMPGHQGAPLKH
jgi:predicted Fe-Mo cluster-binding NifX family protein